MSVPTTNTSKVESANGNTIAMLKPKEPKKWVSLKNTFLHSGGPAAQQEQQVHVYGKWTPFPSSDSTTLSDKLQEMYWSAIHREVKDIILTLIEWERSTVVLDEENELEEFEIMGKNGEDEDEDEGQDEDYYYDDLYVPPKGIHGFDTFLDQVSGEAREFADKYRALRVNGVAGVSFERILADRIRTDIHYSNSIQLRKDIKETLKPIERKKEGRTERRARLLLQSLGFLDIDKLIEYREPVFLRLPFARLWRRGRTPQVRFLGVENSGVPKFRLERCPRCHKVIRGIMFSQTGELEKAKEFICEDCFRLAKTNGNAEGFFKFYTHSVLDSRIITKEVSRKICKCTSVNRTDKDGNEMTFFPVDLDTPHRGSEAERRMRDNLSVLGTARTTHAARHNTANDYTTVNGPSGGLSCPLLRIHEMVAEAKFEGLLTEVEKKKTLERMRKKAQAKRTGMEQRRRMRQESLSAYWYPNVEGVGLFDGGAPNLYYIDSQQLVKRGVKQVIQQVRKATNEGVEVDAEQDVPFFLKKITNQYPFGNVHMSLMIGPLIIENGVPYTNGGVVISVRRPGQLGAPYESESIMEDCVSISEQRNCFVQKRNPRERRLKACMKQVVGGVFAKGGYFDAVLEEEIVKLLVIEAKNNYPDPRKTERFLERKLEESTRKIVEKLRNLLDSRVKVHLNLISQKLFNPEIKLRWSYRTNNCQNFCDNLLDWSEFGPLVAPSSNPSSNCISPMYLFSFLSRPGSYTRVDVKTMFDVPNGITEEYILKFRYGTHDDADIIDTLNQYWYDWGSFGGHLYKHQELFPWDCTEAYGKYPTKCNECNLAKHVWSFPFDSWSIIQLHLAKDRQFYPPSPSDQNSPLNDKEWIKNRLTLLLAQDALSSGALGMTRSSRFRESCQWLATQDDPKLDRVKLGGIHRAQPFSHQFEQGKYHEYLVAHWAHLKRDLQIQEYERLRDRRFKQADVNLIRDNGDGDGDGGGDDFYGIDLWCVTAGPDYCADGFDGAHGIRARA
ncbi:hypothetical protein BDZ91DRAFT_851991 [Kalaharituber pfeilii]|nr:hypothetical protein BDZ91DRAFT_851991 [Kalaharituber pfeilii]